MELALDIFGADVDARRHRPGRRRRGRRRCATSGATAIPVSPMMSAFFFSRSRDDLGRHEPDPAQHRRRAGARPPQRAVVNPPRASSPPSPRRSACDHPGRSRSRSNHRSRCGCSPGRSCWSPRRACALFVYIGVMVPLLPRLIEEELGGNEIDIGINLATFYNPTTRRSDARTCLRVDASTRRQSLRAAIPTTPLADAL